jgi:hypothetical protein
MKNCGEFNPLRSVRGFREGRFRSPLLGGAVCPARAGWPDGFRESRKCVGAGWADMGWHTPVAAFNFSPLRSHYRVPLPPLSRGD